MRVKRAAALLGAAILPGVAILLGGTMLAACASQSDRFYTLSPMPDSPPAPRAAFTTQFVLSISVPAVVDRRSMVLDTPGNQVTILEHERWAAPISDLIAQTLAGDIERRRPDVMVAGRGFGSAPVKIRIDIVELSARAAGNATLEAHWLIADAESKTDVVGSEVFTAPVASADYAAVARAFSLAVSSLADRLAEKLPAR
jgi:uncharacterized lipoprotein YmbA